MEKTLFYLIVPLSRHSSVSNELWNCSVF